MPGKGALVAMLSFCLAMTACSATGECMGKHGNAIVLKGTVRVVGNEPFSRLVLTVPDPGGVGPPTDHLIEGPLAADIRNRLQGKVVTVEGTSCARKPPGGLPCIEPEKIIRVD